MFNIFSFLLINQQETDENKGILVFKTVLLSLGIVIMLSTLLLGLVPKQQIVYMKMESGTVIQGVSFEERADGTYVTTTIYNTI